MDAAACLGDNTAVVPCIEWLAGLQIRRQPALAALYQYKQFPHLPENNKMPANVKPPVRLGRLSQRNRHAMQIFRVQQAWQA